MRVLHAAAEIFPLVKTGGLADVVGALPQAQARAGADVRLVLPGLPAIKRGVEHQTVIQHIGACFGAAKVTISQGRIIGTGLIAYVVDAPFLFGRQGNPYHAPDGSAWPDNAQRFALLGWAAAHLASGEIDAYWKPEILHVHDWHAAMACAYLAASPQDDIASVFTVHNLAYQGVFDVSDFHLLGLPAHLMTPAGLEFHGQYSFIKAGLAFADKITTVSPTYAREIATAEFGCGLEGVIQSRGSNVSGILNGVDTEVWGPERDSEIAANYSATSMGGKAICKAALQKALGLRSDLNAPLLGVVSRITPQKGLDLLLTALPALLEHGVQLVVQGSGNIELEELMKAAAKANPDRVALRLGYDEGFAHQIIAGADMLLVPSRFEPCGLTQLYALRYGTVPVVRKVGGLADTVTDANVDSLARHEATGYAFGPATPEALEAAIGRAISAYAQPALWRQIVSQGMRKDFSWTNPAGEYLALYDSALLEGGKPT